MKRKQIPKKLRQKIFERDNFTCVYCGAREYEEPLEIDHVIPISKGGTNNINNLVTSCRTCNRIKHSDIPTPRQLKSIAKALGTTRVTVSRWESGESDPSDKVKIELAKVLNTTIAYLMGETDSPERNKAADAVHVRAVGSDSISYGYWRNVADNARDVAVSGDKDAIAYVSQMLKRALSLLTVTDVKDVENLDMGNSLVTNMPVMVGKRNENTVTFATA